MNVGPDWLGVGFPRCGTSALAWGMLHHPAIAIHRLVQPRRRAFWIWKERHELDHSPLNPVCMQRWQATFDVPGYLSGEYTTWLAATSGPGQGVIEVVDCAERVRQYCPEAKFLVMVREPGERAWSHWKKAYLGWGHLAWETAGLTFREAIEVEAERGPWIQSAVCPTHRPMPLLQRGKYDEHLAHWFDVFPDRDRTLVLCFERFIQDPGATYRRVFAFLGLPEYEVPRTGKRNASSDEELSSSDRAWLDDFFAPHNAALTTVLGPDVSERIPWLERATHGTAREPHEVRHSGQRNRAAVAGR